MVIFPNYFCPSLVTVYSVLSIAVQVKNIDSKYIMVVVVVVIVTVTLVSTF